MVVIAVFVINAIASFFYVGMPSHTRQRFLLNIIKKELEKDSEKAIADLFDLEGCNFLVPTEIKDASRSELIFIYNSNYNNTKNDWVVAVKAGDLRSLLKGSYILRGDGKITRMRNLNKLINGKKDFRYYSIQKGN